MVNPRQLDFSDGKSPSSQSLPRRKSPRKHASKPSPPWETVAEQVTKKKKKKLDSSASNRIWNEEDELTVLKELVDYQAKKGMEPNSNWNDFYRFLGGSIAAKFSKEQLLSKIRKLKGKFLAGTSKAEAFRLSKRIWGQNDSESANQSKSVEEEEEPLNENDDDDDESCAVRDAFETMMSRGLSDYQKNSQLEKLMNLGSGKRKELSDEWKALCAEEVKLNVKRFRFSAMLAEATNDNSS